MPAAHPDDAALAAFGHGRLTGRSLDTVAGHVDTCADCRVRVAALSADGPRPTAADVPAELSASGEYTHVEELGRGGMGVVYKAHNTFMDRDEVLKVMSRELTARPASAERFKREVQSAARLDHPNVVKAYSARPFGGLLVFAMEYVPGRDLGALVKERGPLPVAHAAAYAQQVAAGLQHAFERGMVHRDVKPQNLILRQDGKRHTVKVLDFGLAKVTSEAGMELPPAGGDGTPADFDGQLTGAGKMLGTPDYIAPEQIVDAQSADVRADIYSLGCTLYFLLTGGPPFHAKSLYELLRQHQEDDPRPVNVVRPQVPEGLAGVVAKMMAKEPARRYQTPAEVVRALAPFVKPAAAPPVVPAPTPAVPAAGESREVAPRPAAAPAAPPWETFVATTPAAPQAAPSARPAGRRWGPRAVASTVVAAVVVVTLVVVAVAGRSARVRTDEGTVVLENLPADADVLVDGTKVTVSRKGDEAVVTAVKGGPHKLKVVQGGREVFADDLTVKVGGEPVRVRVEPVRVATPRAGPKKVEPKVMPVNRAGVVNRVGAWTTDGAELVSDGRGESWVWFGDAAWTDYDFEFTVTKRSGPEGVSAVFRAPQPDTGYLFNLGVFGNRFESIELRLPGRWHRPQDKSGMGLPYHGRAGNVIEQGTNYRVRVEVRGGVAKCWLDGDRRFEYTRVQVAAGRVGLRAHGGTALRVRDVVVKAPDGKVLWEGVPDLRANETARADDDAGVLAPPGTAFASLFNGRDLTGWQPGPARVGTWRVEDGRLTARPRGAGPAAVFGYLFCDASAYDRFQLKVKARFGPDGNYGVYVRLPTPLSLERGYEFDVLAGPQNLFDLGAILWANTVVAREAPAAVRVNEWVELDIVSTGSEVVGYVNGVVVSRVADDPGRPARGSVALQIGAGRAAVEFESIEICHLPAAVITPRPPRSFTPLFSDGVVHTDVTRAHDGGTDPWQVRDGVLSTSGRGDRMITFNGPPVEDFVLRAEVAVGADARAALLFRTAVRGDRPRGYSVGLTGGRSVWAIGSVFNWAFKSGQVFGLHTPAAPPPRPDEWFPVEVEAVGRRFRVRVGDGPVAETFDRSPSYFTGGAVGFAAAEATSGVKVRRVELCRLPAGL